MATLRDLLSNLVTGLGIAGKDKGVSTQFVFTPPDPQQLEAAYRGDWLSRKIVNIPPEDMTREWREWKADDEDIETIEAEEDRLQVKARYLKAMIQARLWGGSAIYIGTGESNVTAPLDIESIALGGIKFLTVLPRRIMGEPEILLDPTSELFGQPAMYELSDPARGSQLKIHPSRIVRFQGAPLPDETLTKFNWGDSVLAAAWQAVIDAGAVLQNVSALTHEAKIDVIRVPGLSDALSNPESTTRLQNRFALAGTIKSIHNILLLEASGEDAKGGEQFEQKSISFDQLPNIIIQFLQTACGAADIPATRLIGQSPAGLNATGESDLRNYYDHCGSLQKNELEPTVKQLDRMIIRSAFGDEPEGMWYDWRPLWQLSATDRATVFKTTADAITAIVNTNTVPDEVMQHGVKSLLIDTGYLPGIEAAYDEFEAGDLEPIVEPVDLSPLVDPVTGQPLPPPDPQLALPPPALAKKKAGDRRRPRARVPDAAPRSLYIYREVKNAGDIIAWAKAQGFETTLAADDMHVTIAYSKQPLDWFKLWVSAPRVEIPEGGPRTIEKFDGGAIVLQIPKAWELGWRYQDVIDAGGTSDRETYEPHITITYKAPANLDVRAIEAYRGKIILGPEIFEEIAGSFDPSTVEEV